MSSDFLTPPYMRGEPSRAKIISVSAVPQAIATLQPFKASDFLGELNDGRYVVWLGGSVLALAYANGEWFAINPKLKFKRNQKIWNDILKVIKPTIIPKECMTAAIRHGRAGVVRKMMGLEQLSHTANKG